MTNLLDHPVINYLIIITSSLFVALICFFLGGSLAEVSGNQRNMLTYKASGALAGFIIVFFLSQWALAKLRREAAARRDAWVMPVRVYVQAEPEKLDPPADKYRCEATLFNEVTGVRRTLQITPRWEGGFLTVDLLDVSLAEQVGAFIIDDHDRRWHVQDFKPSGHTKQAKRLLNTNG
jgi:hypothetical protein